ncbi:hypothetical protein [Paraburkholderia sp.]|uniref:hypothetical protein n=1 Tax=Paraburkholderia sp. TaxID=1926495 RepID=UPI0039E71752
MNQSSGGQALPKALGVLLCYNDAEMLSESIDWLLLNRHDVIALDHGSDDGTAAVLDKYRHRLVERIFLPRDFDFYKLYETMSRHLMSHYVARYDWISWPDQDELLEGPDRSKSYYDHLVDAFNSPYDWIQFNNQNFWFTDEDDARIALPTQRIRHYSIVPDCAPRIRSWRASATNIRWFNHNPPEGKPVPVRFNLRHYPMRSAEQAARRLDKDRADLRRGNANFHYDNMKKNRNVLHIDASMLHFDDGKSELSVEPKFNWRNVYGAVAE